MKQKLLKFSRLIPCDKDWRLRIITNSHSERFATVLCLLKKTKVHFAVNCTPTSISFWKTDDYTLGFKVMVFVTGALGTNDNIFVMKIFQDVVQDVCPLPHHQNQTVKLSEILYVYPISLR